MAGSGESEQLPEQNKRRKSRQHTHSSRCLHVSKTIEENLQQDTSLTTVVRATCFKRKEEKVSRNILTVLGICIYAKQYMKMYT